jgi:hypothetical protein
MTQADRSAVVSPSPCSPGMDVAVLAVARLCWPDGQSRPSSDHSISTLNLPGARRRGLSTAGTLGDRRRRLKFEVK